MCSLMGNLNDVFLSPFFEDHRVWVLNLSVVFSCKLVFQLLGRSTNSHFSFPYSSIWKPSIPPRVKAFSWTVALNRVNTMDVLQRRLPFMMISPNWCVLCKNAEESLNHLFLECTFSSAIWSYFLSNLNNSWVMPREVVDLLHRG